MRACPRHQLPETAAADGVAHQMDPWQGMIVDDVVHPPGVEDPALAGAHVDLGLAARESHGWLGHDGHVYPHALAPVVVHVDVRGHLRLTGEPHQARATPSRADAVQDLPQVGTTLQVRGRKHLSGHGIAVRIAARRHQRQGVVAGVALRVRAPGRFLDGADLGLESRGVEVQGQLHEWILELHEQAGRGGSSD
jgi:hypothetical protein